MHECEKERERERYIQEKGVCVAGEEWAPSLITCCHKEEEEIYQF